MTYSFPNLEQVLPAHWHTEHSCEPAHRVQEAGSRCTWRGREELPHVQGQGQRPRVPGCDGTGTAKRNYPSPRSGAAAGRRHPVSEVGLAARRSYTASEVSGGREETPLVRGQGCGQEELPRVRGQWWPGGDTPYPRSGAARRSHLAPEARGGDLEELPGAQGQGQQLGGATHA